MKAFHLITCLLIDRPAGSDGYHRSWWIRDRMKEIKGIQPAFSLPLLFAIALCSFRLGVKFHSRQFNLLLPWNNTLFQRILTIKNKGIAREICWRCLLVLTQGKEVDKSPAKPAFFLFLAMAAAVVWWVIRSLVTLLCTVARVNECRNRISCESGKNRIIMPSYYVPASAENISPSTDQTFRIQ